MKNKQRNKKQVVWQTVIIQRERDAGGLLAGVMTGDAVCLKIWGGLDQWLQMWGEAQDRPPLCLTCSHEFRNETPAPSSFMVGYSEDPKEKHVVLTGVCDTCAAEKSETELVSVGAAGVSRILDGRILGFNSPTTTTIN